MVLDALFLCLFCTATFFVNTKTIIGPNQVGVNFCCGKNEELVVEGEPIGVSSTTDPSKAKAKCVPITDEEERSSLEGRQIWVGRGDGNGGEMKTLKLLERKKLDCQRGLVLTTVIMNQAEQNVSLTPHHRIPSMLTSGGGLQIMENREEGMDWTDRTGVSHINAGDFCLAPRVQEYGNDDGPVALFCDACAEQAACGYARDQFFINLINARRNGEDMIIKGRGLFNGGRAALSELFVGVCDANGDNAVDFDEFFDKLKFYIRSTFEKLDENKDGSILDEAKDGDIFNSISYQFFEALLNEVFEFFDSNKDGALSDEDDFSEWFDLRREPMDERVTTFNDALDRYLIRLPAPVYNFYAKMSTGRRFLSYRPRHSRTGSDTDKRLTKVEAMDFMTRLFTLIDSKGSGADCKIDVTEVLQLFDQPTNPLEVPWDYRLALKILLDQKLTLVSHLVKAHVERADKDKDNMVTIEEILAFDDFEFLDTEYLAVSELAYPLISIKYLFYGPEYCCGNAVPAMWLTALQNVIAEPIFSESEARLPPGCHP